MFFIWSKTVGSRNKNRCLTTNGFRSIKIFGSWIGGRFFLLFLSFIILKKGRVTSATGIAPALDRKIIVHWRSGIYPMYIRVPRSLLESFKCIETWYKRFWRRKRKRVDGSHRTVTAPFEHHKTYPPFITLYRLSISVLFSRSTWQKETFKTYKRLTSFFNYLQPQNKYLSPSKYFYLQIKIIIFIYS